MGPLVTCVQLLVVLAVMFLNSASIVCTCGLLLSVVMKRTLSALGPAK